MQVLCNGSLLLHPFNLLTDSVAHSRAYALCALPAMTTLAVHTCDNFVTLHRLHLLSHSDIMSSISTSSF